MPTKSEIQTEIISKEYFLPQFTHQSIKVKDFNEHEFELCDCLIEIGSIYITIQIKERDESGTSTDYSWFDKKVLKVAKKQIFDTFNFIKNSNEYKFYNNGQEMNIDSEKEIIPIIVFDNKNLKSYKKIVYSSKLNKYINIFNIEDFKTMLDSIIIPYDILNYCNYRLKLFYTGPLKRVLIDHVDDYATLIGKPTTESELAEFYIVRTYYQHNIEPEYIKFFNVILNILKDESTKELIMQLLQSDIITANIFVDNWTSVVKYWISVKHFKPHPFTFKTINNLILLIPKPLDVDMELFNNYYIGTIVYNSNKYDCKYVHSLIFSKEYDDNYSVSYQSIDTREIINYDEILKNSKEVFENLK